MPEIIKIVVKSSSGYGLLDEAYNDKVTITGDGIRYEYKPLVVNEPNVPHKWSYRTDSSQYCELWEALKSLMPELLKEEPDIVLDGGDITFEVTYADKLKAGNSFGYVQKGIVTDCLQLIKKMVPGCEKVPMALMTDEDYEDEEQ